MATRVLPMLVVGHEAGGFLRFNPQFDSPDGSLVGRFLLEWLQRSGPRRIVIPNTHSGRPLVVIVIRAPLASVPAVPAGKVMRGP